MKVTVRPLRKLGCMLLRQDQLQTPAHVGELTLAEDRDQKLGRSVIKARLIDNEKGNGSDVLPELFDARVLWMGGSNLRLAGFEQVDQAAYAQTWSVEVT